MRAQHQHGLLGQQGDQVIFKGHKSVGKILKAVLVAFRVQQMFCGLASYIMRKS